MRFYLSFQFHKLTDEIIFIRFSKIIYKRYSIQLSILDKGWSRFCLLLDIWLWLAASFFFFFFCCLRVLIDSGIIEKIMGLSKRVIKQLIDYANDNSCSQSKADTNSPSCYLIATLNSLGPARCKKSRI